MTQLTPLQSKVAALAVLFVAIAMAVAAIALPVWLLNQRYDGAVEEAATRLERYSRIVGMRDGLQKGRWRSRRWKPVTISSRAEVPLWRRPNCRNKPK